MTEVDRFFLKIRKTDSCWLWTGHISRQGYGRFYFRQKAFQAHRASYLMFVGEIAEGMDLCHKCDVRNCVNPEHLFVGTRSDNMKDCVAKNRNHIPRHNQLKTHCPKGHEYTPENTWINSKGWRWCKHCNRLKGKANYARTKS